MDEINRKVVIVTGGGTGIGRSSALALQKNGFVVVICGRRKDRLEEVASLADAGNPNILPIVTDVSDSGSVTELFNNVKKEFGRLDVLFNNAGMGAPRVPLDELNELDWRK